MTVRENILQKLELLREYVGYLKEYRKYTLEDLQKDHTLRGAVERYFQKDLPDFDRFAGYIADYLSQKK